MSTNNITLEFTPEALAAFHERERRRPCDSDQLSYATASASTVSDVIGPGRTLDKLLGAAGRLLERGCSTLVERLGRSPNALMANILQWMLRPQPDQCCARCSVTSKSAGSFTRSPPVPFEEIIHQLALLVPGLNGHCTCCLNRRRRQFVQRKDVRKGCKRLIRFLRDKNDSNKELAVLHIVILLAFFPDLCPIFVDLQVILVLENIESFV
ncbi:hypothetical protein NEOLEDRAFT_64979 [Neolentinus lepideus HHB14362 ss-1]|uniref:Uncharacterized protein n=1 Tax=Neolentinus lepideus HHB14362 ss-1 TaxID=1314782 RepID=A0A165U9S3_9AGAM|nr:hypothetical protein NEOLEDRAFT_64979 [Neolentinus lepideus HHB14362 ss-1]